MGHLAVIFAWISEFQTWNVLRSENDRHGSHGPGHFKAEFRTPVWSFWYLLDTQGSYWPKVRTCRSFPFWHTLKSNKYGSVLRFGTPPPRSTQTVYKQEALDVRIQKNHTCVHRTRNPNELREFKNCCVFLPSIEICWVFSRTHHMTLCAWSWVTIALRGGVKRSENAP